MIAAKFYSHTRYCSSCWMVLRANTAGTRCAGCAAKNRERTRQRYLEKKQGLPPRKRMPGAAAIERLDPRLWRVPVVEPLAVSIGVVCGSQVWRLDDVKEAA